MEEELERVCSLNLVAPMTTGCVRHGCTETLAPSRVSGLRCQGHSRPPKASRVCPLNMGTSIRAPGVRTRQAARSSDDSDEGRSLRSSRSAGEPRTWRREAAEMYKCEAAGESHVCGIRSRSGLAPERATQAYTRSMQKPDYVLLQAVGIIVHLLSLRPCWQRPQGRHRGVEGLW
jgi:hypothetical protein